MSYLEPMRRRPWSRPLEICGIVLLVNAAADWWSEGISEALNALPVKAATAASTAIVWTTINAVWEARKQRPS